MYNNETNAILPEALKRKGLSKHLFAIIKLYKHFENIFMNPKNHIMDNKCPTISKQYLRINKITMQHISPIINQTNEEENSIITFKEHFVSDLATVPLKLPLHLWCWIIKLTTTTLNLI